jgi:hypothetical protein
VTLITGPTAVSVGNEIYAYNGVDFSAYASGAEATALDFSSPNDHFLCDISVSMDTGSLAAQDILAIIIRGNGENIYLAKWALGDPNNFGEPIGPPPVRVILPPNTVFRVVFSLTSGTAMVGSARAALVGRKLG